MMEEVQFRLLVDSIDSICWRLHDLSRINTACSLDPSCMNIAPQPHRPQDVEAPCTDPRLLAVEFLFGIMLRETQVEARRSSLHERVDSGHAFRNLQVLRAFLQGKEALSAVHCLLHLDQN